MIIRQTRVRTLERHLPGRLHGKIVHLGITDVSQHRGRLAAIGFPSQLELGLRLLPGIVGPVSRFNAEGKNRIRRDLKKETAFREVEWHWNEFHGDDRIERSDFRYVPYKRYPRELIPPPGIELTVQRMATGSRCVATEALTWDRAHEEMIIHAINLLLEIFGECEILDESYGVIGAMEVVRLNWKLLPTGAYPWKKLQKDIAPILEKASKGKRPVIAHRLESINDLAPDFHAIGQGGFDGYVVFGFRGETFVLESALYGNATYIFSNEWEEFSKLSKAQIIAGGLQKARIVHQSGWKEKVSAAVS
jgi:hypothetical protein